jgi:hypothetical protein
MAGGNGKCSLLNSQMKNFHRVPNKKTISSGIPAMPANPESRPTSTGQDRLEVATDQAIAACGGDARQA